jgi:hypothetical protein
MDSVLPLKQTRKTKKKHVEYDYKPSVHAQRRLYSTTQKDNKDSSFTASEVLLLVSEARPASPLFGVLGAALQQRKAGRRTTNRLREITL